MAQKTNDGAIGADVYYYFKGTDEEIFEQMKSIAIPYVLNIAGYGKEYFFSMNMKCRKK